MLNNMLQKEGKRSDLDYVYTPSGPNHDIQWTACVYCKPTLVAFMVMFLKFLHYFLVAKEQIGQGIGPTKGDAGEAAAQSAYESLSRARP